MAELVMPRLSDTMEEGTILRWLKADGVEVRRGEELVEIETDKATMTYESDLDGVLAIVAKEGDTLAVGSVIAHVGDGSELSPPTAEAKANGQPMPVTQAASSIPEPTPPAPEPSAAEAAPSMAEAAPSMAEAAPGARVRASPLARRIARERGVELTTLSGSGPGGRIVKADVERGAVRTAEPATAPAPALATAPALAPTASLEGVASAKGEATLVPLNRTQQTIARRMAESKATIPEFTLQAEVDMQACVELRRELKRLAGEAGAGLGTPTYNDMVVKACALALREHPRANSSYRDGQLQLHSRVNVGVAVATQEALLVPSVFDADEKSLGEIARETRTLAERVRVGTITPPELGGGTFTVSNLGMYGIESFTAIINPPQAAILSVGAVEPRAVVREQELVARPTMLVTLACDHRILYGADAATFLARIRELLETPASLML
jgi:pyruvate dehydrogenase E2 component (dihydrolipoamide acetyltransferase)